MGAGVEDVASRFFVGQTKGVQRFVGHTAFFLEQREKEMFRADFLGFQLLTLIDGGGHDVLEVRRAGQSTEDPGFFQPLLHELVDFGAELGLRQTVGVEDARAESVSMGRDSEQHVFRTDVFLFIFMGDVVRQLHHIGHELT